MFDLGGGTFDVSVVELFEGTLEVKASSGESALGGKISLAPWRPVCSKLGASPSNVQRFGLRKSFRGFFNSVSGPNAA